MSPVEVSKLDFPDLVTLLNDRATLAFNPLITL
jgi:hypothetical protein